MHKIKGQKGITLIALVITIVVMLILVGVTISVSLNGGLFSTAKEATDETQMAKEREELLIAALGTLNQNGKVDLGKLDSSLPEGFTGSNGQYTSKTGNIFTVTEDGTITLVGGSSEEEPEEPETPVIPPATPTIELNPETITGEIESGTTGEEVGTITVTATNVDGDLTWSITPTDSGLELVDTDNENVKKIKASKAVENATITVSYGTVSDTCSVTVTEVVREYESGTLVFKTDNVAYLYGDNNEPIATYTGWNTETYSSEEETPWHDKRQNIISVIIENGVTVNSTAYWFYTYSGSMGGEDTLVSVEIGSGITSIDEAMFYGCADLTDVSMSNNVTNIEREAFFQCLGLSHIQLSNNLTSIGPSAFMQCDSLASITIPLNVTNIGSLAFYMCYNLTSVTINNKVTNIYAGAFGDCQSLTNITFNGTVAEWNAITFSSEDIVWNHGAPATEVICSDGTVKISQ